MSNSPVVAIWRSDWLPRSETFIRDQVQSLSRWRPVRLGVRTLADGLPPVPDYAPFRHGILSRILFRLFRLSGRHRGYRKALAAGNVSLVHAHFGTDAVFILPVMEQVDIPLIVTFHGMDVTRAVTGTSRRVRAYRRRLLALFDRAAVLVAVSEFIAGQLTALGAPEEKIRVHHIGVSMPPPESRHRPPTQQENASIVFVGRLVEKKGADDLISAISLLPEDLSGVEVVIIGDGPLRGTLEEEALATGVSVDFRGVCSSEEVRAAMMSATLVCSPSKTASNGDCEGLPMSIQEAASCGVPVVATRHAGIPEFLIEEVSGLLVDEGDPEALAEALARVLRDPEWAGRLGAAGRERVEKHFNLATQTRALEDIYDEATDRSLEER